MCIRHGENQIRFMFFLCVRHGVGMSLRLEEHTLFGGHALSEQKPSRRPLKHGGNVVYLYIYLPEHARGHNIYFYRPCLHTQCIFVRTILGDTTYISTDHASTHNIYLYRPCSGPQHISLGTMLAHATLWIHRNLFC